MTQQQRQALIDLCHAIRNVAAADEVTRFRANRLLHKLNGRYQFADIFA